MTAIDPGPDAPPTAVFDALLETLHPTLNEVHGTAHTRRFWSILLYRYLSKVLIAERSDALWRAPPHVIPSDETVMGLRRGQAIDTEDAGRGSVERSRRSRSALGDRVRRMVGRVTGRGTIVSSRSVLGNFHHYDVIASRVERPSVRLPSRPSVPPGSNPRPRERLREMAGDIEWPTARQALLWLPDPYVEKFRDLHDSVAVADAPRKEFHAAFLPTPFAQMTVACYAEAGSRLSIYQHAAMYGEVPHHVLHHAESGFADRFRTWGWTLKPKDERYLALRLMKPAGEMFRRTAQSNRRLYVIVRQPLAALIDQTLEVQRRFFDELGDAEARQFVMRPRINKGGRAEEQVLPAVAQQIASIDDGETSMVTLVDDAELVILDMLPSTAFMECLTASVPVLAIVPPNTVFTDIARPFYEEFARLGVLHHTPESAGAFVRGLSVSTWWQDVISRDSVRDYLDTFCNRDASTVSG